MSVHVFSAAGRMGEQSNWTVSNLAMQKLVYLAHMFWLSIHGEPLVDGHLEA